MILDEPELHRDAALAPERLVFSLVPIWGK
jgi:hypothetical protein